MKNDSKKKKKKKKKQSKELDLLKELKKKVKKITGELKSIKAANQSLQKEVKKLKKKNKKKEKEPKVVTSVMEPQVLPPEKTKVKRTRKTTSAKSKPASTSKTTATRRGPKPAGRGRKPGPKPARTRAPRKPASPGRPASPEDLKFIQGLGAKIESLLNEQGVKTFADLAKATQTSVKGVLEQAGPRFKNQDPKPLITQAKLVKDEKWSELESLQAELMKGKKKPGPKART